MKPVRNLFGCLDSLLLGRFPWLSPLVLTYWPPVTHRQNDLLFFPWDERRRRGNQLCTFINSFLSLPLAVCLKQLSALPKVINKAFPWRPYWHPSNMPRQGFQFIEIRWLPTCIKLSRAPITPWVSAPGWRCQKRFLLWPELKLRKWVFFQTQIQFVFYPVC